MAQSEQCTAQKPYLYHLTLWILCASAFISGIGFAYAHHSILFALPTAIVPIFYALTQSRKCTLLIPLLFSIGYLSLIAQRAQHAHIVQKIENKRVNIEAYIESIEPVQHTLYRYIICLYVQKTDDIKTGTSAETKWRLQCYTNNCPRFEVGDTVAFNNITIGQTNGASFYNYLVKEQIHATVFLKTDDCHITHHPKFHAHRALHGYKHAILKRLRAKCSRIPFALVASVFLGNRNCVKKEYQNIKEQFHHWGIIHFLARSGLHLIIFILLLQLLLQCIPISLHIKHLLTLGVTIIYAALSWQSISFARACATFGWYKMCHLFGLQLNVAHIVIMLSCLFLLINPSLLFFLDFQLSFGLTLILSLTNQLSAGQK